VFEETSFVIFTDLTGPL